MTKRAVLAPVRSIFRFPFEGPGWQNRYLVGAGLLFLSFIIPIVPAIFVYGYMLQIMRQAIAGKPLALPEWDDWARLGKDGLRVFLVALVFLLPALVVFCASTGLYAAGALALPTAAAGDGELAGAVVSFYLLTFGLFFIGLFASSLLAILGFIPLPMATAHVAAEDSVVAAIRFGEWWPGLRKGALDYFIAWVIFFGLIAAAYLVFIVGYYSIVLCCLLPFVGAPLAFYVMAIGSALFGENYRTHVVVSAAK